MSCLNFKHAKERLSIYAYFIGEKLCYDVNAAIEKTEQQAQGFFYNSTESSAYQPVLYSGLISIVIE